MYARECERPCFRFAPACIAACEALGVEVSVNTQVAEEGSWKPAQWLPVCDFTREEAARPASPDCVCTHVPVRRRSAGRRKGALSSEPVPGALDQQHPGPTTTFLSRGAYHTRGRVRGSVAGPLARARTRGLTRALHKSRGYSGSQMFGFLLEPDGS